MSFCFSRAIQYVDADLFFFILNKSLPKERIIKPTGVTTIKYTIPITKGATMEPKSKPNFIHNLFSGVKNFEFKIPKIKKNKSASTYWIAREKQNDTMKRQF